MHSNRVRPPNLPRRINRYVQGLPYFLVSLPLLQFGHATLRARYSDRSADRYCRNSQLIRNRHELQVADEREYQEILPHPIMTGECCRIFIIIKSTRVFAQRNRIGMIKSFATIHRSHLTLYETAMRDCECLARVRARRMSFPENSPPRRAVFVAEKVLLRATVPPWLQAR